MFLTVRTQLYVVCLYLSVRSGVPSARTNFITYSRCTRTEEEIFIPHQNILADALKKNGGDEEDRTPDLLNANQALSQLSYVPVEENGGPGKI